jgi:iron complex outermembrane receptor protein
MNHSRPAVVTLATLALALPAGRAHAQRAPADTLRPDSARATALGRVVIEALRAPVPLLAVPASVTVREPRRPDASAALALDAALRTVPGVQVDDRQNVALGERVAVRGFGARAPFGVRGLAAYVDGIPATLADGQTNLGVVDPAAVRGVEVLRGPWSALHGNAAGGAILLRTLPSPEARPWAELGSRSGDAGLRRQQIAGGGRLASGPWVTARATRLARAGWRDFSAAEQRWGSASLFWPLASSTLGVVAHVVEYDAENPGSLSDSLMAVDRRAAFRNNVAQRTGERGRQRQLGVRWERPLGGAALELTAHALDRRIDNPIPARVVVIDRTAGGVRAALRSPTSADAPGIRWSLGTEERWQRDDRQNYVNAQGSRGALVLDQLERVGATAAFAQLGTDPSARVAALAGLRHDRTRFRVHDRRVTTTDPDDSGERTLAATSPSLGATLRLAPAVRLHATVATAFETPTTTEMANRPSGAGGFNPALEPQRTISYEVGGKGTVGRVGSWELTAYEARVRDALVPFEVADVPGRQFFRNAGRSRHRGIEGGVALASAHGVRLDASYTLTDARFTRFATGGTSHDGRAIPGVARHRAAAVVGVERPRGWFAELSARAQSRMAANDANDAWAAGYGVVDVRAGVRALRLAGATLELSGGIDNLLDARYVGSIVPNAFGRRYYEPAAGRTANVGVRVRLGDRVASSETTARELRHR